MLSRQAGIVFGERYRTVRLIASGGMGAVYAAEDIRTGQDVAVKVVHQRLADREQTVERFRREAQLLHQIDHPGVVRIFDCGIGMDGLVFLVMELLHGETLRTRVDRNPIPPGELIPIVDGIADVLESIHRAGLVHRDLKPSNVFLSSHGSASGATEVKLIDFGVAKAMQLGRLTATGEMLGTPRFMSPEQLRTPHAVDHRADVFALGVLTYIALAGRAPFPDDPAAAIAATLEGRGIPLSSVASHVPSAVGRLLESAMNVDPHQRPPSARAFADSFQTAASGPGVSATISSAPPIAKTVRLDAESLPAPAPPTNAVLATPPLSSHPSPSASPWAESTAPLETNTRKWVLGGALLAAVGGAAAVGAVFVGDIGIDELGIRSSAPDDATAPDQPPTAAPPAASPATPSAASPGVPPVFADGPPTEPPSRAPEHRPSPAAPETRVYLLSEPSRAMIREGDVVVGSTPLAVLRPAEGTRRYSLALPGYRDATVSVGPHSPEAVTVQLIRRRARRRVRGRSVQPEPSSVEEAVPEAAEGHVATSEETTPAPDPNFPPPTPIRGTEVVCPFDPETCAAISQ